MPARKPLIALGLVLAALAAYSTALRAGWIWDDDSYVTENPNLEGPGGLARIWLEPRSSPQYYPLVFTSFWLERRLWGLAPFGSHLVNVLVHAASALLFWRLLARLRVPGALFAAAAFLLHPVCVESVAWVTERKNVLALFLFLASALAYLRWRPPVPGPEDAPGGTRFGWLALALFACALFSKTVTASLPAVLLLVTWWKRGRLVRADLAPLVAFFALGAALGLHTAHLERTHVGAVGDEWELTLAERLGVAVRVPWFYLGKLVWPSPLAFFYPRWSGTAFGLASGVAALSGAGVLAALFLLRERIGRGPLTAALYFGGMLVPASGLFDVYPFRYSFVADHFQYLAMLGPIALAGALGASFSLPAWTRARPAVAALLLLALGVLTWRQGRVYADAETLWRDTIAKNPDGWAAYTNLGLLCAGDGRHEEGEALIRAGFERSPAVTEAWPALAFVEFRGGRLDEALRLYRAILRRSSSFAPVVVEIALAAAREGRLEPAARLLALLTEEVPDAAAAQFALGSVLAQSGRFDEARGAFEAAARLDPGDADAHASLGRLYARQGERELAAEHLRRALALDPGHAAARALLERLSAGG